MAFSKERFSDKYRLGAKLGEGHFGTVREATEKSTGRRFAVKVIVKNGGDSAIQRLHNEAEITLSLSEGLGSDSGIARAVEAFEDDKRVYIVMEILNGGTLAEYIVRRKESWGTEQAQAREEGKAMKYNEVHEMRQRRREKVEAEAGWIIGELATALAQVHDKGVVHRDMKPENVLIRDALTDGQWVSGLPTSIAAKTVLRKEKQGNLIGKLGKVFKAGKVAPVEEPQGPPSSPADANRLKIADFGLAERIAPGESATEGLVGSPAYVAPEVILGSSVGAPSDVWGLGVILFFVLTDGRLPFYANSTPLLLRTIRKASIDMNSPALIGVSSEAKTVLQQLLAADPMERPTAAEVAKLPWVENQMKRRLEMLAN